MDLAKAKRIFEVAKDLGVASKAIVAKCQAEGVPDITNHMSTVKLGLVETIRQWFSNQEAETDDSTAIETTKKVDLTRARKARRRRKKVVAKSDDVEATAVTTIQAPAQEPQQEPEVTDVVSSPAAPDTQDTPDTPDTIEADSQTAEDADLSPRLRVQARRARVRKRESEATPDTPVKSLPDSAVEPEVATPSPAIEVIQEPQPDAGQSEPAPQELAEQSTSSKQVGVVNVPSRPKVIERAGELLSKPQGVQLKGPQLIRMEKPDELRAPRPKRQAEQSSDQSIPGMDGAIEGITRSKGPVRGRGAVNDPKTDSRQPRSKRRSTNTRRGRSAEGLPTGPTKFTEADLAELDARLRGAPGYLKQRRRALKKREGVQAAGPMPAEVGGKVDINEPITIKSLSSATGIKAVEIIKYLLGQGVMATVNSMIDTEAAMEVALEYNIELVVREQQSAAQQIEMDFEQREVTDLQPRPPVVTVLGHVDHGKTSLLDRIRKADVAQHEAGGITQHVGAYRVTIEGHDGLEKTVVFLDTPGHEAFTSMRARGAGMTDLIVLVVAADDGVMPQTIESINHAKAAGVTIVVALNKVDRPEATEQNIQRIYGQLAEHGLNPVEWGGSTEVIKTSAETGDGITELLETLDFQAELLELKADFSGRARGMVIESEMQEGRGPVARVLIQQGQIKVGDFMVIGRAFGRVRDMTDDHDRSIRQAGPSTPLELSGIDKIPDAGDRLYISSTLQKAEEVATHYRETERQQQLAARSKVTLDTFADQMSAGQVKELRVVVKADVQGSIDVLTKTLNEQGNDEVSVKVIHAAVGGINESDVLLADASDAVIFGFQVVIPSAVREIAEQHKVDVRLYRVIYDVLDDVKKALEGMLTPEQREEVFGSAEVKEVFRITKLGMIAGCVVTEGTIQRKSKVRVARNEVVIIDGRDIESLRRVKDDASEVRAGTECGLRISGFDDLKVGDQIVCYKTLEVKRTLD
jgi:translation initiation factor IF-2